MMHGQPNIKIKSGGTYGYHWAVKYEARVV